MAYRIKVISHGRTLSAQENDRLADIIQHAGIDLRIECNKKGLCGKCFVEILKGAFPPLGEHEKFLLQQKHLNDNFRLACSFRIHSDLSIKIPDESLIRETPVLTSGIRSEVLLSPAVKKYLLWVPKPKVSKPSSVLELVQHQLKHRHFHISLPVLEKDMEHICIHGRDTVTAVMYQNRELLAVEPGNTQTDNYGIAVDIGTTTLAMDVTDLNTGKTVDSATALNPQVKHGADVVSRITHAFSDTRCLQELEEEVQQTLNTTLQQLLKKNCIDALRVYDIVVAGNTAMNHLFLGVPVHSLAQAPYHSVFASLPELPARDVGFDINPTGKVYISPNIKSFVGGDVSAGLIASDFASRKGTYLYIDLGTNGEIVLKTGKNIIATSTAAGPAFEGMKISCGMLASPGAIYRAEFKNRIKISTIGNEPASGICGTGLIDLLAVFLEKGEISQRGAIKDKGRKIPITNNIFINQKDIQELQLAIAAIKTGIKMILYEFGLSKEQLDGVYVAGAFGHYLNIKNTMKLGLLPQIEENKIVFIGNASLAGAKTLLLSASYRKTIEKLVRKIRFVSLASLPSFQQYFLEAIEFKPNL